MNWIDIPTEQTTALTDFCMGLAAAGALIFLYRLRTSMSPAKTRIWSVMLAFLGLASFIGSAAHGIAMSKEVNFWLWQPINFSLGLVIAMFVAAAVFEVWGEAAYRKTQLPVIGLAVLFYGITLLIPGTFLPFIVYEAAAMLFALAGYLYLAIQKKLAGAWWLVVGILITILAAVIQAVVKGGVVIFLGLDHNGVFHLIQLFSIPILMAGMQKSLPKRKVVHQLAVPKSTQFTT